MIPREGPDAIATEEFIFIQHPREDSAEPFLLHQGENRAVFDPKVLRSGGMHTLQEFRHAFDSLTDGLDHVRHVLPLPLLDDCRGTERKEPDHGTHLESLSTPVGKPEDIVIKTVFLVPHAVLAHTVYSGRDPQEVLEELIAEILVRRVMGGRSHTELGHVLAEKGHPGRAVGLLQVPARRKRCAPVENADVVQSQESPFKHVLAEAVFPVDPPGEIQHELGKGALQEVEVSLPSKGLFRLVKKEGGPCDAPGRSYVFHLQGP